MTAECITGMRLVANATADELDQLYSATDAGKSRALLGDEMFNKHKGKKFEEAMKAYSKGVDYLREKNIATKNIASYRNTLGALRGIITATISRNLVCYIL
jgi:hypothetical protein